MTDIKANLCGAMVFVPNSPEGELRTAFPKVMSDAGLVPTEATLDSEDILMVRALPAPLSPKEVAQHPRAQWAGMLAKRLDHQRLNDGLVASMQARGESPTTVFNTLLQQHLLLTHARTHIIGRGQHWLVADSPQTILRQLHTLPAHVSAYAITTLGPRNTDEDYRGLLSPQPPAKAWLNLEKLRSIQPLTREESREQQRGILHRKGHKGRKRVKDSRLTAFVLCEKGVFIGVSDPPQTLQQKLTHYLRHVASKREVDRYIAQFTHSGPK